MEQILQILVCTGALAFAIGTTHPSLIRNEDAATAGHTQFDVSSKGDVMKLRQERNSDQDLEICKEGAQFVRSGPSWGEGRHANIQSCQTACKNAGGLFFSFFDGAAKGEEEGFCRCSPGGETMTESGSLAISGSVDCVPQCTSENEGGYLFCVDLLEGGQPGKSCSCLDACPKGTIQVDPLSSSGRGYCVACEGKVSADRKTCDACGDGYITKDFSDECIRFQDTCNPEDCGKCENCMSQVTPAIAEDGANGPDGCFHPGQQWGAGWSALSKCQVEGPACFFKILCQYDCICTAWKNTFCGGLVGNLQCSASLLAHNASKASPQQNTQKVGNDASVAESLEESLSGKRSC